jgi:nucleotide-binding universal stress UspA family protein
MSGPLRVMVPFDFSEGARGALGYALRWASRVPSGLHVVHVVEADAHATLLTTWLAGVLGDLRNEVDTALAVLSREERRAVGQVERHVVQGHAADDITALAARQHIDLLVVGAHRHTMGEVAAAIACTAPCPVLFVKPGRSARAHQPDWPAPERRV